MSEDTDVLFAVGEKFYTFEQLEEKILRLKEATGVELWKSGARTIDSARKSLAKLLSADLKYYQVRYSCLHSSRKLKTTTADGFSKTS